MPIEFDYTLKRYEESRTRIFKPDAIKSPLANISVISAPNSSGKSTLMNIIALSLFGTDPKAESVNESLKKQISSLTDHKIQDIVFSLKITDKSGKNGLLVSKNNFDSLDIDRKQIIDGVERHIDSDRFHGNYKLIYDIPDSPLERLKELTYDIKAQQTNWQSKLTTLMSYVNTNIKDLLRRKQEYDVPSLKEKISKSLENIDLKTANITTLEEKSKKLNKYYYLRKYLSLNKDYEEAKEASKAISKEKKETVDERNTKVVEFREKAVEQGRIQETIKSLKETLVENIVELAIDGLSGFSKWSSKVKQAPTRQSVKEDLEFIETITDRCKEELEDYNNKSTMEEVEFYDKLVSWIRTNMGSNYQVPGTEMTFSSLIDKLDSIITQNRKLITKKHRLENVVDWIRQLKESIRQFEELGEIMSTKHKDMSDAQRANKIKEISESKRDYDAIKKGIKKDMQSVIFELSKLEVNESDDLRRIFNALIIRFPELNRYEHMSFNNMEDEIAGLMSRIGEFSAELERESLRLKTLEKQLDDAKNVEPHKYEGKDILLSNLFESVQDLSQKISKWEGFIAEYKHKSSGSDRGQSLDPERTDYFKRVSRYLARKMVSVTYIDKKYYLAEVDLIDAKFIATDGTVIYFEVMGTGQRQLTYILNKLSYDGRVIIAMFDEVALMTSKTMRDIVDKMRNLNNDNEKLLAGLLVSPSDEVKITEW